MLSVQAEVTTLLPYRLLSPVPVEKRRPDNIYSYCNCFYSNTQAIGTTQNTGWATYQMSLYNFFATAWAAALAASVFLPLLIEMIPSPVSSTTKPHRR